MLFYAASTIQEATAFVVTRAAGTHPVWKRRASQAGTGRGRGCLEDQKLPEARGRY